MAVNLGAFLKPEDQFLRRLQVVPGIPDHQWQSHSQQLEKQPMHAREKQQGVTRGSQQQGCSNPLVQSAPRNQVAAIFLAPTSCPVLVADCKGLKRPLNPLMLIRINSSVFKHNA